MTRASSWLVIFLALTSFASTADALPRFAARQGSECTLCHVSPSGGGVRNRYGSNVFQRTMLGLEWSSEDEDGSSIPSSFSGELNEWLSIGSDLRVSYIFTKPKNAPRPGTKAELSSDFFLMQADLYTSASFGKHAAMVLDFGAYSGFEAWLLLRAAPEDSPFDLFLRVGRFMPSFGIREVNHDLYTRGGIGLGSNDRDTGFEVTGMLGPLSLSVSLVNGTFDDSVFDTRGSDHRSFEKAVASRGAVRFSLFDTLKAQVGGSFYFNDNVDTPNPLFAGSLSESQMMTGGEGLTELRAGPFLLASIGRFVYIADLVYVRDKFVTASPSRLSGYASFQELNVLLFQGLDVGAAIEFMDPDTETSDNSTLRVSLKSSLFLNPFIELEVIARRTSSRVVVLDKITDVLVFAHAFF